MINLNKVLKTRNEQSRIVIKNAFFSFFIKGLNIAVSFLTIPLVLSFLNTTQYGIWLTLTAVLSWFSLFDLGFGNGLRNHLTIVIAEGNFREGKTYVSTTYAALAAIFGLLLLVFLVVNPFVNWGNVFNAPSGIKADLNIAVFYAISLLLIQFVLRLINTVLLAFQRAAMADFTNALVQVFILGGLYVLKFLHYNSLSSVALVYSLIPVILFLVVSVLLFSTNYKEVSPSFLHIRITYVKKLLNLGLSFFVIQVSSLILFATDNFIITQLYRPADVTVYNIAFKYFSIGNIILTIFLAPFWSMATKAYVNGDYIWIKNAIKKFNFLWGGLVVIGVLQLLGTNILVKIWTHNKVIVPLTLAITMLLYFILLNWSAIYSNFLNAVGKVKLQLYYSVIAMILNIPLAIVFTKYFNWGIIGVPLATMSTMIIGDFLITIQYKKIVSLVATGIWNK